MIPGIDTFKLVVSLGIILGIVFGSFAVHHKGVEIGRAEIQAKWDKDKVAQAAALAEAQAKAAALAAERDKITSEAEASYAALQSDYSGLAGKLSRSLLDYARLRSSAVPAAPAAPGAPDGAGTGAGGDSDLAELARLQAAVGTACLHDAAELTTWQEWWRRQSAAVSP